MKIKKDRFRKSRGGTSQIYELKCSSCNSSLLKYQKDGTGALLRLYIDRIIEPKLDGRSNLLCIKCKTMIGIPMIYKAENRLAYRLVKGSFSKKRV